MSKTFLGIIGLLIGIIVAFTTVIIIFYSMNPDFERGSTGEIVWNVFAWSLLVIGATIGCYCGVKLGTRFRSNGDFR